mmetsp:Transcript_8702/g.19408  ORF Transcript_8702/g.19408 Transcript_8702/m.19408 type:complete len:215 (+) Transcript_8702:68-712(+)
MNGARPALTLLEEAPRKWDSTGNRGALARGSHELLQISSAFHSSKEQLLGFGRDSSGTGNPAPAQDCRAWNIVSIDEVAAGQDHTSAKASLAVEIYRAIARRQGLNDLPHGRGRRNSPLGVVERCIEMLHAIGLQLRSLIAAPNLLQTGFILRIGSHDVLDPFALAERNKVKRRGVDFAGCRWACNCTARRSYGRDLAGLLLFVFVHALLRGIS